MTDRRADPNPGNRATVIISEFDSREDAERALRDLKDKDYLDVRRTAIVTRAMDGEVHVHHDGDVSPAEGALVGTGFGALVGGGLAALTLPGVGPFLAAGALGSAIVGAIAGGITGAATAALVDLGFDDEEIHVIKHSLTRGHTVLVADVKPDRRADWDYDATKFNGRPLR